MVGTLLGNYRLDSEVGSGGMGTVYRATHMVLGSTVAIKLLRGDLMTSPELVTRFANEAKAASAIRHPNIVEVFDFGHTEDGRAYLVMEFLRGESLSQRMAQRGPLPAPEATRIARGIADALTAAHAKSIVHRDLKPDNVFLVPDPELGERPKLLDFGIAKLGELAGATKYTQTGALMGTPLYMAPEQARAAAGIDRRADLYSLGCMLYEMLVGAPPFSAEGAGEIIALHLFGKVEPPSARAPGITAELDTIVMRLLEKEPDARFQHATEVVAALDRTAAVTLPMARKPSIAREAPIGMPTIDERPPPRRTSLPVIAAAATLLIAGILAGVVVALRREPDAPQKIDQHPASAPTPAPPPAPPPAPVPPVVEPPAPAPVKQPTRVKKGPTTKKGSPIENSLD